MGAPPVIAQSDAEAVDGLVVRNDGAGTLYVTWNAPAQTPTDYRVNWAKSSERFPSWRAGVGNGNEYPATNEDTLEGLEEGVEYKVRVRARYSGDQLTEGQNKRWATPWSDVSRITTNNTATGAPTITGTTEVGQTLTANTSNISDDDGLDDVTYSYQWLADTVDISGATARTYLLTTSEMGKAIKVRVSFTDESGNDESLTSVATGAVSPAIQQLNEPNTPAEGAPTITGTAQVGQTLTAATSDISDDDGLTNVIYSYQWVRNDGNDDSDISDATGRTYTLVDDDEGKTIKVKVSFTDDEDNDESLTSAATSEVEALSPPEAPTHGDNAHTYHVENGENWVALRWTRPSGTVDGYKIYRQRNSRLEYDFQLIATIDDPSITAYNDYDVEEGSDNYYQVRAFNEAGLSPASDLECGFLDRVTTEGSLGLEAPDRASARLTEGGTAIQLTWSEPTEGYHGDEVTAATGYQILRWDRWYGLATFDLYVENTGTTTTSFIDRDILPDNTYTYVVRAWNDWGLGDRSDHAVVDTGNFDAGSAPSGVTVTTSDAGPKIAWSHPDDVVATEVRYRVFRRLRTGAPAPMQVLTSAHEGTSYVDTTAAADTEYYYAVGVYNGSNQDRHGKLSTLRLHHTPKNYPAAGSVAITGTAEVGQTLTAVTSDISDKDGLENVSYSYQWIRNDGNTDADISDAIGETYTLVDDDKGVTIKVRVSFTDDADNAEELTSPATATVTAKPNTAAVGSPAIRGTAQVGQTLTAHTSDISDEDGLENVSYSYQWVRNDGATDSDIDGATSPTYTLAAADEGMTIKVKVSFTDDEDNPEALTSAATETVAAKPNTAAAGSPTITGAAQVGQTLTADTSNIRDDDGLTNVTYSYQWVRNDGTTDSDIDGETSPTYTLAAADEGMTIKVKVSFTDDEDNPEALTSAATETVAAKPNTAAAGSPTITGAAQVGQTLTADTSNIRDDDGLTNVTYSYQWVRNDGTTDSDIDGETSPTYTLAAADEGMTIKVKVSFTDDEDNPEALTSAATESVAPEPSSEEDAEDDTTWTATMTPALLLYGHYGYSGFDGARGGALTTTEFAIDGVTYTVKAMGASGWMYITFDREIPTAFTIEVDGTRLDSTDASFTSYSYGKTYEWQRAGISWSDGDEVELKLYETSRNTE